MLSQSISRYVPSLRRLESWLNAMHALILFNLFWRRLLAVFVGDRLVKGLIDLGHIEQAAIDNRINGGAYPSLNI